MNEKQFTTHFQKQLLSRLLQKYERSQAFRGREPVRQRPQLSMQAAPFKKDYYDEMDFRKKEWMNTVLSDLEQRGIVSLTWVRFREGQEVSKVYLNEEALEQAYALTGVRPKEEKMERLREILSPLRDHPWEWVREWQASCEAALSERRSGGLDLDDPDLYRDLVKVLRKLPELETDMPKRLLSQSLFNDSKRFEQTVETRLLSLLKKYADVELERDEEYLDSVGIVQNPKLVQLTGAIRFEVNGNITDLSALPGGAGLSVETVNHMNVVHVAAKKIITIENLTSYHQWITQAENADDALVIYTGGFPHRTLQLFLRKLSSFMEDSAVAAVYHWGDMDLGGIRIFEYIRLNFFEGLIPLYMDAETFEAHKEKGIPLSSQYASKVKELLDSSQYTGWRELLRLMDLHQVRIEQESIF